MRIFANVVFVTLTYHLTLAKIIASFQNLVNYGNTQQEVTAMEPDPNLPRVSLTEVYLWASSTR